MRLMTPRIVFHHRTRHNHPLHGRHDQVIRSEVSGAESLDYARRLSELPNIVWVMAVDAEWRWDRGLPIWTGWREHAIVTQREAP